MPLAGKYMYEVMNLAITQGMALWAWCENVLCTSMICVDLLIRLHKTVACAGTT